MPRTIDVNERPPLLQALPLSLQHLFAMVIGFGLARVAVDLATKGASGAYHGSYFLVAPPGKGTTLRVYLPRAEPGREDRMPPTQAKVGGSETILLVEDEDAVRTVGERLLRRFGYTVVPARSGEEALGIAATHAGPIDLVLTDVILPGMDGQELTTRLVAQRPAVRVLYVSGYAADRLSSVRPDATWGELLQKPFSAEELARAVRAALGRPAAAEAPADRRSS